MDLSKLNNIEPFFNIPRYSRDNYNKYYVTLNNGGNYQLYSYNSEFVCTVLDSGICTKKLFFNNEGKCLKIDFYDFIFQQNVHEITEKYNVKTVGKMICKLEKI